MSIKYFTYQLFPVGEGSSIAPSGYLPDDSDIGYQSGSLYYYYGRSNIESIDIISKFDPVEITEAEFLHVYDYSNGHITGSL
jgi:hypothetical protein